MYQQRAWLIGILFSIVLVCARGQTCSACDGLYRPPGPHMNVNTSMASALTETIELHSAIEESGGNYSIHLNYTSDKSFNLSEEYGFSVEVHDSPACNISSQIETGLFVTPNVTGGFWYDLSPSLECQTVWAVVMLSRVDLPINQNTIWIEKNTTVPNTKCFPLAVCCPMVMPSPSPSPTPSLTPTPTPIAIPSPVPPATPTPTPPPPAPAPISRMEEVPLWIVFLIFCGVIVGAFLCLLVVRMSARRAARRI